MKPQFLVLLTILFFHPSQAKNIYISPTGSDSTGDGSYSKPFSTLWKASFSAVPGDHIQAHNGVYLIKEEPWEFTLTGTASAPIYIEPVPGAKPILDGRNVKEWYKIINLINSKHVVIQNLEIRDCKGFAIYWWMCSYLTIQYNKIHGITRQAISGNGDYVTIQYNEVWNSSLLNLNSAYCPNQWNCGGWPAEIMSWRKSDNSPSTNYKFLHNTIRDSWGEGIICFYLTQGEVAYNKIYNVYSVGIYCDTSKDINIHRNFIYSTNTNFNRPDLNRPLGGISVSTEYYSETQNIATNTPSNIIIANNLMVKTGNGIFIWRDSRNTKQSNTYKDIFIYYNVIYQPVAAPMFFNQVPSGYPAPTNCKIRNNIIVDPNNAYLELGNPSGWTLSNNNWANGVPAQDPGLNEISFSPAFVNPTVAAGPSGFALQSTSQVRNKGIAVSVTVDYFGKTRSSTTPTPGIWEP